VGAIAKLLFLYFSIKDQLPARYAAGWSFVMARRLLILVE